MKRIYPDDMQLDDFLVLNETDYYVLSVALEELCSSIPMEEYYHSKKVSQDQYDLCKAKILTRKNLQGDKN